MEPYPILLPLEETALCKRWHAPNGNIILRRLLPQKQDRWRARGAINSLAAPCSAFITGFQKVTGLHPKLPESGIVEIADILHVWRLRAKPPHVPGTFARLGD